MTPRVVIPCPADTVSGGPEALHQLGAALRSGGVDASLFYYPSDPAGRSIPLPYRHYDVAVSTDLPDDPGTLVIINETVTALAWRLKRARKAIWWLSVDNFFKWRHANPGPDIFVPRSDIIHLCQSAYAMGTLARRGARPLAMLTDYITEGAFTRGTGPRMPAIAYNPKKGEEVIRMLMQRCGPDVVWVALEGLSKTAMADVLRSVRVYVDFGGHPGRDRIPREAALCGAVVVTGRRGAAAFAEDIPIPDRYRRDETNPDFLSTTAALLTDLLGDGPAFGAASEAQAPYRTWIAGNRRVFEGEVASLIDAHIAPRRLRA